MLACTGNFLERDVRRWIDDRQWTLGDVLLTITAAALSLASVISIWGSATVESLIQIGALHALRDLPLFVSLPVMLGIFCVACFALSLAFRLRRVVKKLSRA
ncbi:MAG: hypothetical protein WCJ35_25675 [Planctomycetota bacterium]